MDEIRTKGIIIDAQDYKEYDKLITIFTLDLGVVKAVIKGVKKSNAKLRFAGQLLCFADFILTKRLGMYTVINADLIDSFYEIAYNYDKFLLAVDLIKVVKFVNKYNPDSSELFVVFVAILNVLLKTKVENNVVYCKFLIETLKALGYEHEFCCCEKCRKSNETEFYFEKFSGAILCGGCVRDKSLAITKEMMLYLEKISKSNYLELEKILIFEDNSLEMLKILQTIFKSNCI